MDAWSHSASMNGRVRMDDTYRMILGEGEGGISVGCQNGTDGVLNDGHDCGCGGIAMSWICGCLLLAG